MARGPLRFRQRDVSAAVKALKAAGVSVARIEIGAEGVTIVPGEPTRKTDDLDAAVAKIDRKLQRRRAQKQGA